MLTIYHCYFCGLDFGLSAEIQLNCPCCLNEDDVLMITEVKYEANIFVILALGFAYNLLIQREGLTRWQCEKEETSSTRII